MPLPRRAARTAGLLAALATGCGGGTAALVGSGGSGGGGSSNGPPAISAFEVQGSQSSPARIRFRLADPESNAAEVTLFLRDPAGHTAPLAATLGQANPASYATSSIGIVHEVAWDFPLEPMLPDDGSFAPGFLVYATVAGGVQSVVPGLNAVEVGLGNDAPAVALQGLQPEVSGIVPFALTVADSSDDLVSLDVEFDVEDDEPDAGWIRICPALAECSGGPPEPTLSVGATAAGAVVPVFWDSEADLPALERTVRLRFRASDAVGSAPPLVSAPFVVDNNRVPLAQIAEGLLAASGDERRGIPIPFAVRDEESDPVRMVFQWRAPQQAFPALPGDAVELAAILADPDRARAHQICTELPVAYSGFVGTADASSVELPELGSTASGLLARGFEGLELEILRPPRPAPAAASWSANPLAHPVAAAPLGDGRNALVLDRHAPGAWRLLLVELASGGDPLAVSIGTGEPSALALEPGERSALVATESAGAWRLARIDLESGAETELALDPGQSGPLRGILGLGTYAALATAGDALWRIEWSGAPRVVELFDGLATPWGVVAHPVAANRVLVAEHDAAGPNGPGRVTEIALDTRARIPVVATPADPGQPAFPLPTSLALDPEGRLLATCVTDAVFGGSEIRRAALAGPGRNQAETIVAIDGDIGSVATGRDGLLLATVPASRDLLVGGGSETARAIAGYDSVRRRVLVDPPFAEPPRYGRAWRILRRLGTVASSPAGVSGAFVWDSREGAPSGKVFLRAIPLDSDVGVDSQTGLARRVRSSFDGEVQGIEHVGVAFGACAADLDRDGDLDVVESVSNGASIAVFPQTAPRVFDPAASFMLGGNDSTFASPVAADLDRDGDLDLAALTFAGGIEVFFQTSPMTFDPAPLVVQTPAGLGSRALLAADLDQDGDQDLACTNPSLAPATVTVFFQEAPGSFAPPIALASPEVQNPNDLVAGDVDGDGDIDLATANRASDCVTVFHQIAPGIFEAAPEVLLGPIDPAGLALGDLDQDGRVEIATASLSGGVSVLRPGIGGTVLQVPEARSLLVAAGDADGDRDLDLAIGQSGDQSVLVQDAPGSFAPGIQIGGPDTFQSPMDQVFADLDGDGRADLLAGLFAIGTFDDVLMTYQERALALADPSTIASVFRVEGICTGDIDRDGDLDLVTSDSGNLLLLRQIGSGVFDAPIAVETSLGFLYDAHTADLDGDDDLDIVSGWSQGAAVFLQDPPGVFAGPSQVLSGLGSLVRSVDVGDLDQDGDLDIAAVGHVDNRVGIYRQIAPGVFASIPQVIASGASVAGPWSLAIADLDQDQDLDVAVASLLNHRVTVFRQTSPGVFANPIVLVAGGVTINPDAVVAADLDGDGDQDLASANQAGNNVTVFLQAAPGVFAPPLVLTDPSLSTPMDLAVGDLDHDRDIDIVVGSSGTDRLVVFEQTSPGVFRAADTLLGNASTDGPNSVLIADLDADGDPDVVSADGLASTITVSWGHR